MNSPWRPPQCRPRAADPPDPPTHPRRAHIPGHTRTPPPTRPAVRRRHAAARGAAGRRPVWVQRDHPGRGARAHHPHRRALWAAQGEPPCFSAASHFPCMPSLSARFALSTGARSLGCLKPRWATLPGLPPCCFSISPDAFGSPVCRAFVPFLPSSRQRCLCPGPLSCQFCPAQSVCSCHFRLLPSTARLPAPTGCTPLADTDSAPYTPRNAPS